MSESESALDDYERIASVVDVYLAGARSGSGAEMKPAFHSEATVYGYVREGLFAGPIQQLFDWNVKNGPAANLEARIASIDLVGSVATVRLELDNWTGDRFIDLFTLLKVDDEWKIMNKVFHLHT